MGTKMSKAAYTMTIEEDIQWLEGMSTNEHSLEMRHIIMVLKESIDMYYSEAKAGEQVEQETCKWTVHNRVAWPEYGSECATPDNKILLWKIRGCDYCPRCGKPIEVVEGGEG